MNIIRRKLQAVRRSAQKGFTLIELAIVGIFLGLLAIFAITQFSGSATDTTKANGIFEATTKIADNWSLLAQSCGISSDITATDLTVANGTPSATTAANNLDVLLGVSTVNGSFSGCYATSGVRPLVGVSTGGAGAETIQGYKVSAANTTIVGRNALALTFGDSSKYVPDSLILPLYNKYSSASGAASATSIPNAPSATDNVVRYTINTARQLTLVRAL